MRPEATIQGLRRQAGSSPALVHLVSPGELSRRPSPRAGSLTDQACEHLAVGTSKSPGGSSPAAQPVCHPCWVPKFP